MAILLIDKKKKKEQSELIYEKQPVLASSSCSCLPITKYVMFWNAFGEN